MSIAPDNVDIQDRRKHTWYFLTYSTPCAVYCASCCTSSVCLALYVMLDGATTGCGTACCFSGNNPGMEGMVRQRKAGGSQANQTRGGQPAPATPRGKHSWRIILALLIFSQVGTQRSWIISWSAMYCRRISRLFHCRQSTVHE